MALINDFLKFFGASTNREIVEDDTEEQKLKQDLVNKEVNSEVASANASDPSMQVEAPVEPKGLDSLMQDYLAGRANHESAVKEARATDRKFESGVEMAQALANLGQSSMRAKSGADIKKTKFAAPKFDSAGDLQADRKGQLSELLTTSKLQDAIDKSKPKQLSELDKRELGLKEKELGIKSRGLDIKEKGLDKDKTMSDYQKGMIDLKQQEIELKKKAKAKDLSMTEYQREILKLKGKELDLKEKVAANKKDEPDWKEKEKYKADLKQGMVDKKEMDKETKAIKKSQDNLSEQLGRIKRARSLIAKMKKNKGLVDTGPLDQYAASFSEEGQELRQALNDLSLDKMSKLFQGMSKAVDSDAERKMFEQSQASMSNFPEVNIRVLESMEKGIRSLQNKNSEVLKGLGNNTTEASNVVNDTVLLQAPDGQTSRVKRSVAEKYIKKGAKIVGE